MPGVIVTTAVRSGAAGAGEVPAATWFVAGETERGPIDEAKLLRSMADYVYYYGDYGASYLWKDVKTFFEEGGGRVYVYRVTGSGATAGYLNLEDQAASAQPTLKITAANPGSWSDQLKVAVENPGISANTFRVKLYLNDVLIYTTRDCTSPADAVNVINSSGVSHLVVASDLESVTGAPDNNPAAVSTPTALSAGTDGSAVTASDIGTGLAYFREEYGPGAVSAPGWDTDVWDALLTHAGDFNRVALCGFASDATAVSAKAAVANQYADVNAMRAGFYFPYVKIPSPVVTGLEIEISPESYVAGARARAINTVGPWKAAAGLVSEAKYITGLATYLTKADGDALDEKRINALRKIGSGIRIYGARSVSSDEDNWRYLTAQEVVNHVVYEAERRLEDYVFETIDGREGLFHRIEGAMIGMLDPIRINGGLFEARDVEGKLIDPGYSVLVSAANNPIAQLALGRVNVELGLRVSSVGDQIYVTVTKANLTSSV